MTWSTRNVPSRLTPAACVLLTMLAVPPLASAQTPTAIGGPVGNAPVAARPAPMLLPETVPDARPATTVPGFSSLFTGAVSDLRSLPTSTNLTWLGIGAVAALASRTQDGTATAAFSTSSTLRNTMRSGAALGGMPLQFGGAMATYALGRFTDRPGLARVGADLVRAQLVAQTLSYGLKYSIRRTRPDGTSFSFPSGHTSVSVATATVLQRHYGWKAGLPAYAVAAYVAGSRVQQRRHYLSDVAFGAAIGLVAGRTVTVGRGQARFAVAPTLAPGGGGIGFTWVGRH